MNRIIGAIFCCLLCLANCTEAATLFVDQDSVGGACSDGRDRSAAQNSATPVCSIPRSLSIVLDNDIILVRKGLYSLAGTINLSKPGVSLRSFPNEPAAILDFTGAGPVVGVNIGASSATLEGFEIRNAAQECVQVGGGATNTIIRRNHIHHCGLTSVSGKYQNCLDSDADGVLVESNNMHDSGSHIAYITGNNVTLRNNLIYRSIAPDGRGSYGIQLGTGPYTDGHVVASHVTIVHNIIGESVNRSGIVLYAPGATIDTVVISNNIIFGNAQYPIYFYLDTIFSGASEIRNNIFAENLSGNTVYSPDPTYAISGNVPLTSSSLIRWVDRTNHDFRLLSGSPAIDAALPGLASTDFDGKSRPIGPSSDIGAYEYGAGQDTVPPAAPARLRTN